jgi:S1-C subfamily serine protease
LDKLKFLQTRNPDMGKPRYKVTMGIMPDYAFEGPGVRIDGVTDDRPAAKAGIQQGDILVEMDGSLVKNMKDYMAELGKRNKGDTIPVKVKRGNEIITLTVTF